MEQDNFDKENTYQAGGITTEWNEKITRRLEELDAYKNPVVILPIGK